MVYVIVTMMFICRPECSCCLFDMSRQYCFDPVSPTWSLSYHWTRSSFVPFFGHFQWPRLTGIGLLLITTGQRQQPVSTCRPDTDPVVLVWMSNAATDGLRRRHVGQDWFVDGPTVYPVYHSVITACSCHVCRCASYVCSSRRHYTATTTSPSGSTATIIFTYQELLQCSQVPTYFTNII